MLDAFKQTYEKVTSVLVPDITASIRNVPLYLSPDQLVIGPYVTTGDEQYGHMEHHVTFHAQDGTELNGWLFNRGANKPLVVWYPGKYSHVGVLLNLAVQDTERSYLFMNYRGFGWSKGVAKEWNMVADARHCLALCRERIGGYSALIIAGYSLGSGVAVQVAAAENADKLLLLTPYDCIYHAALHLANQTTPLPEQVLQTFCEATVGGMFNSVQYAPQISCPVVIYFAQHDTIIPHWSTWNLFNAFSSTTPKDIWIDCQHEHILGQHHFHASYQEELSRLEPVVGKRENPWVMVEKGDCYYNGAGGYARDAQKALEYYRIAAECGFHWGYYNVGKCYLEGQGVEKNDDEARIWFRKAEETAGNPWATYWLAEMGDPAAALRVAEYYATGCCEGWGMQRDEGKAEYFRNLGMHCGK